MHPEHHDPDCATRCPFEAAGDKCRVLHSCSVCEPDELDNLNRYDFPDLDYRTNGSQGGEPHGEDCITRCEDDDCGLLHACDYCTDLLADFVPPVSYD